MKLPSTASTTKLESKRLETTETVEGMKGRKADRGLTLSFMRFVMLYQCFCITVCSTMELFAFAVLWVYVQFWFSMIWLQINVICCTFAKLCVPVVFCFFPHTCVFENFEGC